MTGLCTYSSSRRQVFAKQKRRYKINKQDHKDKTQIQKIQMKLKSSLTIKEECGGNDLLLGKQDHKEVTQAKGHNAPIRFAKKNMMIYSKIRSPFNST